MKGQAKDEKSRLHIISMRPKSSGLAWNVWCHHEVDAGDNLIELTWTMYAGAIMN
jgi:hypothetical protein